MTLRRLLYVGVLLLLSGCASTNWWLQAGSGQWRLWRAAQPVAQLLANPGTDGALAAQLRQVLAIVDYASRRLGIDDDPGYHDYVDLDRRFVLWNVFAAPPDSLELRQWCFPVAGCVAYRGYFDEDAAQAEASRLQAAGFDTYVGGVAAYSTLGWLTDPVLSTWIWRDSAGLAALVGHELAHRRLYVPGDTMFNESLASAIEEILVTDWLGGQGGASALDDYHRRLATREHFSALLECVRIDLSSWYLRSAGLTREELADGKAQRFDAMRRLYQQRRAEWPDAGAFDDWMARPMNNARLLSVLSYRRWVPVFRHWYAEEQSLAAFLDRMDAFAALPASARGKTLREQEVLLSGVRQPCDS